MPLPAPIDPSSSEQSLAFAMAKAYRDAETEDEKARAYVVLAKFVHVRPLAEKLGFIELLRDTQTKIGWGKMKTDPRYQALLELAPDERT